MTYYTDTDMLTRIVTIVRDQLDWMTGRWGVRKVSKGMEL
jgi:hypothetical protein